MTTIGTRYAQFVAKLKSTVLESAAETTPGMRQAAASNSLGGMPDPLRTYLEKVNQHAWKITDDDVAALKSAGYSEDQIFELTVAATIGAALGRLERGTDLLRKAAP